MTRVLGVTLARGGSKRIPNKNVAMLGGRPLIAYTFASVWASQSIDYYVVSTDCPKVQSVCKAHDVPVVHRPESLAQDDTPSAVALQHAVDTLAGGFDVVVELMATAPFKTSDDIDSCVNTLIRTGVSSVVSVSRLWDHHPSRIKSIGEDGYLKDFYPEVPESRRQDLRPAAYIRSGGIYVVTTKFLKDNLARYGNATRPFVMHPKRALNIDEPIDMLVAEAMIQQ